MQSVSSNAVAQALTGYQTELKRYSKNLTLNNSDVATYGYKSMTIPSDISNDKVVAVNVYTSQIGSSNGFQITPIYCGAGTFYFTYYKPTSWAQTSITYTFTITYLS
jgi:hypothetical protein